MVCYSVSVDETSSEFQAVSMKDIAENDTGGLESALQELGIEVKAIIIHGSAVNPGEGSESVRPNPSRWDIDTIVLTGPLDKLDNILDIRTPGGKIYSPYNVAIGERHEPSLTMMAEYQEKGALGAKPKHGLHIFLINPRRYLMYGPPGREVKKELQSGVLLKGELPKDLTDYCSSEGIPISLKEPNEASWSSLM